VTRLLSHPAIEIDKRDTVTINLVFFVGVSSCLVLVCNQDGKTPFDLCLGVVSLQKKRQVVHRNFFA
jgi:hypothetical protein